MVTVGKHLVLARQEGAAGVHQVDAGQAVGQGNLLRPQVLANRQRVVGATLYGGVVCHDDDLAAADAGDTGDDPRSRGVVVVQAVGGQGRQLQQRAGGIVQLVDPVARQQLASGQMALPRPVTTASGHAAQPLAQFGH